MRADIDFFLANDSDLERQAKTKAVENALANAKALADGVKLKIIEVIDIVDLAGESYHGSGFGGGQGQQGGIGRREIGLYAGDWTISTRVSVVCRF